MATMASVAASVMERKVTATANAATTAVIDRMKANGWYSGTSPTDNDDDLQLYDEEDHDTPTRTRRNTRPAIAPTGRRQLGSTSSAGSTGSTGSEGWRLWQTVNERVKEVTTAVKKRTAIGDGLCESDDEDFQGPGDSHLTRIMKEYYIERSSSAGDLPAWLFPDHVPSRSRAWEDDHRHQAAAGAHSTSAAPRTFSSQRPSISSSSGTSSDHESGPYISPIQNAVVRSSGPAAALAQSATGTSLHHRTNEHGSRTAQKLRQMKSTRGL